MSEAAVIAAACANKDAQLVVVEDRELFDSYADVYDFLGNYLAKHKVTPSKELIEERFEVDLPDVNGKTEYYLSELKNTYTQVRIAQVMDKAAKALKSGSHTGQQIVDNMVTSLSDLAKFGEVAKDINLADAQWAMDMFMDRRAAVEKNNGVSGIPTNLKAIDCCYPNGMAGGQFIVLMGYSGKAKSFFMDYLAVQAWLQGFKVMIVSLEMTGEEQAARIYPMLAPGKFTINDLSRGDIDVDDFREWGKTALGGKQGFTLIENTGTKDFTPNSLQAAFDKHQPDIIFFDYMQLAMDNAKSKDMTPRMMNLSRELKLFSVRNNVPVVAVSAVTDDDNKKRDAPPQVAQISWSRQIEFDAALIVAVHKIQNPDPNVEMEEIEIACRKNRYGPQFNFILKAKLGSGEFWEDYNPDQ